MTKGISAAKRYRVLERDHFACRYCGAQATTANLVMDHLITRKHGGRDYEENLVAACDECNAGKSDKLPTTEFVSAVKIAQRDYDQKASAAAPCHFCANTSFFTLKETGDRVCGICKAVFAAGAAFARAEER